MFRANKNLISEKLVFLLKKLKRKTWVRCVLFSLVAVLAIALSMLLEPFIPQDTVVKLGADALGSLLNILATSMLTVAVFSASIMVSSFGYVATSATPRASRLFVEDPSIQNTLATFIGAFLYSIIALVGIHAHIYGGGGRLILFGFTLVILLVVVVVLLRWMDFLSALGRMSETVARVQKATVDAMGQRLSAPWLCGVPPAAGAGGVYAICALPESEFNQVTAPALFEARLVQDLFLPLLRYGARTVEVGCALQPALAYIRRLNQLGFDATLNELSDYAIAQAVHADTPDSDLQRLREAARPFIFPDNPDAEDR